MSGGQTILTCGLAAGLHVCVCEFWGFLCMFHLALRLMPFFRKSVNHPTSSCILPHFPNLYLRSFLPVHVSCFIFGSPNLRSPPKKGFNIINTLAAM